MKGKLIIRVDTFEQGSCSFSSYTKSGESENTPENLICTIATNIQEELRKIENKDDLLRCDITILFDDEIKKEENKND